MNTECFVRELLKHKYVSIRSKKGLIICTINTRILLLDPVLKRWQDKRHLESKYESFIPLSFHEYISKKDPFIS